MPKGKKPKAAARVAKAPKAPVAPDAEQVEVAPEPKASVPMPVVEGVQVVAILEDGMATASAYHCRMADGTTRHVEKSLFREAA